MPDFDASAWEERSPITGGLDSAGIGFFRTTVTLDVPVGYDVLLSFNFKDEEKPYRVEMWVNGWQMGRRVANLGCVATDLAELTVADRTCVQTAGALSGARGHSQLPGDQVGAFCSPRRVCR